LAVVGAVTDVDVPVQALQRSHSAPTTNGRAPIARTLDASGLPETWIWPCTIREARSSVGVDTIGLRAQELLSSVAPVP